MQAGCRGFESLRLHQVQDGVLENTVLFCLPDLPPELPPPGHGLRLDANAHSLICKDTSGRFRPMLRRSWAIKQYQASLESAHAALEQRRVMADRHLQNLQIQLWHITKSTDREPPEIERAGKRVVAIWLQQRTKRFLVFEIGLGFLALVAWFHALPRGDVTALTAPSWALDIADFGHPPARPLEYHPQLQSNAPNA